MFEEAVSFLKNSIDRWGISYSQWYIGITDNPEDALFTRHGVLRTDPWASYSCVDADTARRVESYLLSALGTKGDTGGGSNDSKYTYAYKISSHTNEE